MLDPEYIVFEDLILKKLFRIPDFQRAYSWETKQRSELFEDIIKVYIKEEVIDKSFIHFMSTIVCLEHDEPNLSIGTSKFDCLDIVDGQQRITTLIILLKAISKKLSEGNKEHKQFSKEIDQILIKQKDDRAILLQTNHDNSGYLTKYLKSGKYPDEVIIKASDRNLINAFKECEGFVNSWVESQKDIVRLLIILKYKLGFIYYKVENPRSVYSIFESLNSRGLPVDWLDKCKSMLMGLLYDNGSVENIREAITEIKKIWSKIYHEIGNKEIPGYEILRFAATLHSPDKGNRTLSAEDSLEYFRHYCNNKKTSSEKVTEVTNYLLIVSQTLKKLYSDPRLEAVTDISHARLLALAINLNEVVSEKERKILLSQWEITTFRIFGMIGKDSRFNVGAYTALAKRIVDKNEFNKENNEPFNIILNSIKEISKDYDIKMAISEMKGSDVYTDNQTKLRYFLFRYEESLWNKAKMDQGLWTRIWDSSASKTIEHIFPQTPDDTWKGKLKQGIKIDQVINRLGNMILLPQDVNSMAKNKSFLNKKSIYKMEGSGLKMVHPIIEMNDWNLVEIEKREEELLQWAEKAFNDITL